MTLCHGSFVARLSKTLDKKEIFFVLGYFLPEPLIAPSSLLTS